MLVRSNGVTKVRRTAIRISRVTSSASASRSKISLRYRSMDSPPCSSPCKASAPASTMAACRATFRRPVFPGHQRLKPAEHDSPAVRGRRIRAAMLNAARRGAQMAQRHRALSPTGLRALATPLCPRHITSSTGRRSNSCSSVKFPGETGRQRTPKGRLRPVAPVRKSPLGALPEWNLADLYAGLDDPAVRRDLAAPMPRVWRSRRPIRASSTSWRAGRTPVRRSARRCAALRGAR